MPPTHLTTFDGLRRRLGGAYIKRVGRATEAERCIEYLQGRGFTIATDDDVLAAIEADPFEEELSAYRCVEGVAVSHASDGWWLLFPHGSVERALRTPTDQPSQASGAGAW